MQHGRRDIRTQGHIHTVIRRLCDTDPVAVTKCVTQCFTESVTVADMCAGNGADRGRDVRGWNSLGIMDDANIDELRYAEL